MKPDLLLTWPTNCDYPPWRGWLQRERDRFARVIINYSPHPGARDYSDFVWKQLDPFDVDFLPCPRDGEWRDGAVNAMLDVSDAEWVLFAEQDFFIEDPLLWRTMAVCRTQGATVIGTRQDERWHPCWLLVRRDLVDATSLYFGPEPVDHFYRFGEELRAAGATFADLGVWAPNAYRHMAGLSRNHQLVDEDRLDEIYKPEEFVPYLRDALTCSAQLDFFWAGQACEVLGWYAARMMRDG